MKRKEFCFSKNFGAGVLKAMMMSAVFCALFTACSDDDPLSDEQPTASEIEKAVQKMTLQEKICQMIFVRPESMVDSIDEEKILTPQLYPVTGWDDNMQDMYDEYPVGGFVLFAHNIVDSIQLKSFNATLHSLGGSPMLCVDEEGGRVARIAKNSAFGLDNMASAYDIGSEGNYALVTSWARYIGNYVKRFGFDVDLAPVADVWTNSVNTVIGKRSYSSNPDTAAVAALTFFKGLASEGVQGCYKHFPGHGDTTADTHYGYADTYKTWDEMLNCEMKTFKMGIDNGLDMIMTAHIRTPNATSDGLPASLSKEMLTDKLRGELGFKGVIITDALAMGAISNEYTVEETAVMTVKAGVDIILMPLSIQRTVDAIMDAIDKGEITESRIDESVKRILTLKAKRNQ